MDSIEPHSTVSAWKSRCTDSNGIAVRSPCASAAQSNAVQRISGCSLSPSRVGRACCVVLRPMFCSIACWGTVPHLQMRESKVVTVAWSQRGPAQLVKTSPSNSNCGCTSRQSEAIACCFAWPQKGRFCVSCLQSGAVSFNL